MTKKSLFAFAFVLLQILLLVLTPAFAENGSTLQYYVSDVAGVLNESEWQELEAAAEEISEQFQCGVYLVTLNDYTEYGSYSSFWDFSEAFYSRYQMGMGDERNGILLIMSMEDRDYSLLAYGADAHRAFTDYGKSVLENGFLDDFRRNDWYNGFKDYISGCGEFLNRAAAGEPIDVPYESRGEMPAGASTAIVIGCPALLALGTCESMRRRMKPVKKQSRADEYIVPGGINLSIKRDVFINRTVTRTVIHDDNRDSHFSGGTSVNSHGFSGHSGKF